MITIGLFAIFIIFCVGLALVKSHEEYSRVEKHALNPTEEVVASSSSWTGLEWVSCAQNDWTELGSLTVLDEKHEMLMVQVLITQQTVNEALTGHARLRVVIDGTTYYYPSDDYTKCPILWSVGNAVYAAASTVFFTIPRNIAGNTIYLDFWNGSAVLNYKARIMSWGHTPHTHR